MILRARSYLFSLTLGMLAAAGSILPAQAAQTINFLTPSPLKFSLNISSLETIKNLAPTEANGAINLICLYLYSNSHTSEVQSF